MCVHGLYSRSEDTISWSCSCSCYKKKKKTLKWAIIQDFTVETTVVPIFLAYQIFVQFWQFQDTREAPVGSESVCMPKIQQRVFYWRRHNTELIRGRAPGVSVGLKGGPHYSCHSWLFPNGHNTLPKTLNFPYLLKKQCRFVPAALPDDVFFLVLESLLFTPLSPLQALRLHPPPCAILPAPSGHSQPVWPGLPLAVPLHWISSCLDLG